MIDEANPLADRFMEIVGYDAVAAFNSIFKRVEPMCESEIEKLFLLGLLVRCRWDMFPYSIYERIRSGDRVATLDDAAGITCLHPRRPLVIFTQHPVREYRLDFLLAWAGVVEDPKSVMFLGIECDGHNFHDRTKEQAQRDKSRDRKILASGVPVMRFTGSELFRAPVAAGCEALSVFLEAREEEEQRFFNHLLEKKRDENKARAGV